MEHLITTEGPDLLCSNDKLPLHIIYGQELLSLTFSIGYFQIHLHKVGKVRGYGSLSVNSSMKCSECGKDCVEAWRLKRHMMTHTGEKPFTCSLCPYATTQKQHLAGHVSRKHKILMDSLSNPLKPVTMSSVYTAYPRVAPSLSKPLNTETGSPEPASETLKGEET